MEQKADLEWSAIREIQTPPKGENGGFFYDR
jgi:hypothetical protein